MKSKQSLLKYFQPADQSNALSGAFSDLDIESGFNNASYYSEGEVKFLKKFSKEDILNLMQTVGLVEHLESKGFNKLHLEINVDEALINHLKIYYRENTPENILINLRVSESRFVPEKRFIEERSDIFVLDMVVIEWLYAQNPFEDFDPEKPQLPRQKKPGLGSLNYLMEIMYHVAKEVVKDGFMDVPEHFHGAVMYSRKFRFFNPIHEAILKAILRDLSHYSLVDLSWGMITKTIIDKSTGEPQDYESSEQIFPVSRRMQEYFSSRKYREQFKEAYDQKEYYLDYNLMQERRNDILKRVKPEEL